MANMNTKRRLGKTRRSVITDSVYAQFGKHAHVIHNIVGPGVRGVEVNSSKLRKQSGKKPWMQGWRNQQDPLD